MSTGVGEVAVRKASLLVEVVALTFREPVPDKSSDVAAQANARVLSRVAGLGVVVKAVRGGGRRGVRGALFSIPGCYLSQLCTPILQDSQNTGAG